MCETESSVRDKLELRQRVAQTGLVVRREAMAEDKNLRLHQVRICIHSLGTR